ncbi:MAG: helix-turn-helix domain-containing protein [Thermoplasmata archaeon]
MKEKSKKVKISSAVLKDLIENYGYSIEELAKKLKVPTSKINDVEMGKEDFTLNQIKKLSQIYNIPIAAFFSEDLPYMPEIVDYRVNREKKLNPWIYTSIRRAQYLANEIENISGKRSVIPNFSYKSPIQLAEKFRDYLGVELHQAIKGKKR